jgi:hypothetical protein
MSEVALPRGAAARLAAVPMPPRIAALARDRRGYPIPRFIDRLADKDGQPDFRIADTAFLKHCVKRRRCWICGEMMGRFQTFPIGPMCAITRTNAEPPSHLECCRYSVQVCPFLAVPEMRRIEKGLPEDRYVAGEMIKRNPGAVCLWTVEHYQTFKDPRGLPLFHIGEPTSVEWWCEGRTATRAEVDASIESGVPILEDVSRADPQPGAMEALAAAVRKVETYLPLPDTR